MPLLDRRLYRACVDLFCCCVEKFSPAQHDAKLNVPEGYFNRLAEFLVDIQTEVARPILVCLLPDGESHGVSTDLRKLATSFDQQLRAKGT